MSECLFKRDREREGERMKERERERESHPIGEMLDAKTANSDDQMFTYFITTGHVTRMCRFISSLYTLSRTCKNCT